MVKVGALSPEEQQQHITTTIAPRRPRVREVSSRFMSPVVSSSSSGDLHLPASKCSLPKHTEQQHSQSVQRIQQDLLEPLCSADENRVESSGTPFLGSQSKSVISIQKKQQRAVKLYNKENSKFSGSVRNGNLARSRTDTPTCDRMTPRPMNSTQSPTNLGVASTAAAKLVQLSGMAAASNNLGSSQVTSGTSTTSIFFNSSGSECEVEKSKDSSEIENFTIINAGEGGMCNSPHVPIQISKMRLLPDFRSSMPEVDLLPTMSSRLMGQRSFGGGKSLGDHSKVTITLPCYRSLSEQSFSSSAKLKHHPSTMKSGGISLPPHPSNIKMGTEPRKGRKILSHQEDVLSLRLLQNQYLQWRYANAKAEAAMKSQLIAAKGSFHALAAKISELSDSVKEKHNELGLLRRNETLTTIIEYQMPYLDQWSALEGDYSSSLSGVVKALQDASLRLPIIGNVRADIREVGGALNSASNVIETMSSHVESFLPKAEEMDTLISELAGVVSRERALIEECGDLLTRTHMLQVEECSLRGQLIQMK